MRVAHLPNRPQVLPLRADRCDTPAAMLVRDSVRDAIALRSLDMRPPSAPRPALTRVHALIVTLSTTLLILGHALPASAADPTTKAPAPAYAPGPAIEPVHPGQPLPFLPPLPGMQVGAATVDDQAIEFVPLPDRVLTLGPPLVRVDYVYAGPAQRSARQVLATYRQALQQAGWTLQSLPRAPDVLVALYAQQGRCLRLKLHSVPGTLHVTIWEPAAHADPARLRQALAQRPDVAYWLLECANLPPYSAAITAATGLPVFDVLTMSIALHQRANQLS